MSSMRITEQAQRTKRSFNGLQNLFCLDRLLGTFIAAADPDAAQARDYFFSKQRQVLDRLPMRHIAKMQMAGERRALRFLDPSRDRFRDTFRRPGHDSRMRGESIPIEAASAVKLGEIDRAADPAAEFFEADVARRRQIMRLGAQEGFEERADVWLELAPCDLIALSDVCHHADWRIGWRRRMTIMN